MVGAIGLLVAARLAWDPTIVGADPGAMPIVNWLLWGYGVPALAFFLASRIMQRHGRDRVVRFAGEPVDCLCCAPGLLRDSAHVTRWRSLCSDERPSRGGSHRNRK